MDDSFSEKSVFEVVNDSLKARGYEAASTAGVVSLLTQRVSIDWQFDWQNDDSIKGAIIYIGTLLPLPLHIYDRVRGGAASVPTPLWDTVSTDPLMDADGRVKHARRCLFATSVYALKTMVMGLKTVIPRTHFVEPRPTTRNCTDLSEADLAHTIAWLGHTYNVRLPVRPRHFRRGDISWRVLASYLLERAGMCSNYSGTALRYHLACGDAECYRDLGFLYDAVRCSILRVIKGSYTTWYPASECRLIDVDSPGKRGLFAVLAPGLSFATTYAHNAEIAGASPFLRLRKGGMSGWHGVLSLAELGRIVATGVANDGDVPDEVGATAAVMRKCWLRLSRAYAPGDHKDIHICMPVARLVFIVGEQRSSATLFETLRPRYLVADTDRVRGRITAARLYGRTVFLKGAGADTTPLNLTEDVCPISMGGDQLVCNVYNASGNACVADDRDWGNAEVLRLANCEGSANRSLPASSISAVDLSPLFAHENSGVLEDYTSQSSVPSDALFNTLTDLVRVMSAPDEIAYPTSLTMAPHPVCSASVVGCMLVIKRYVVPPADANESLHMHPSHIGPFNLIGATITNLICNSDSCFAIASCRVAFPNDDSATGKAYCSVCRDTLTGKSLPLKSTAASLQPLGVATSLYAGLTYDVERDKEIAVMPSGVSNDVALWFRYRTFCVRRHEPSTSARQREIDWRARGAALMEVDRQGMFYLACACLISRCLAVSSDHLTIYPPTDRMGVLDPPALVGQGGSMSAPPDDLLSVDVGAEFCVLRAGSVVSYQLMRYAHARTLDIITSYVPRTRYGIISEHALSRSY